MTELLDPESQASKIEKLLALLPAKVRGEAACILEKKDEQSLQLLTNIISTEHANRRIRALLVLVPGASMLIGALLSMASGTMPWYMGIAGLSGVVLLPLSLLTASPTALEMAAVETVVLSGDKHSIGALLETLPIFALPAALRQKRKEALIGLLQSLTVEDTALLPPAQLGQLCHNLNYIQRDSEMELRLATLTALQHIGDPQCLGAIYMLAAGEAATHTAQMVRAAARSCAEKLGVRLDFGPVTNIPEYTDSLVLQMQSEGPDYQVSAVCMLALRQLLPKLQASDCHSVLSERQRDRLYQLLTLPLMIHQDRYGINELQEEVLRTAHRLADTRALASVRKIASVQTSSPAAKQLRTTARETLRLLEAQAEKEKESRTLLRGASSPHAGVEELLRAAAPSESLTTSSELLRSSILPQEPAPFKIELPAEESTAALLQRSADRRA